MPQPPRQLRFDSVLVAPPGTREYSRPASDGAVQYTSRDVAADLGRRCLKLRDVARVSYGDNDGSPPALEVRGKGNKCSSLRCSFDAGSSNGDGRREILSFAEDLVAAHKKTLRDSPSAGRLLDFEPDEGCQDSAFRFRAMRQSTERNGTRRSAWQQSTPSRSKAARLGREVAGGRQASFPAARRRAAAQ